MADDTKLDFNGMNIQVDPGAPVTLEGELAKGPALSIISLVDCLIDKAHASRASDIHLDPTHQGLKVRLRIDGNLQETCVLPGIIHEEVISRIKILCGLRTDEHQAAQDGRFRTQVNGANVDVRVSVVPTYYGENAILRLLAEQSAEHTLELLGYTPENAAKIIAAINKPHGMVLVTGPTGSGKTTTLYTLIKMLNSPDVSILTIEDPVEYAVAGVNQIQVNPHTGLTFAHGLRSMLRQDPNIIMVGEIRDTDTAALAVNTALTGHLLLSTLHTNDAPTTLPRLLDMKVEPYLMASTFNIAIGQRLVRQICAKCKEPVAITDAVKESVATLPLLKQPETLTLFKGKGCEHCNGTGYSGRISISEVMPADDAVREAILRHASASDVRKVAIEGGMKTMLEDGFQKALAGHTTLEEVLRAVHD